MKVDELQSTASIRCDKIAQDMWTQYQQVLEDREIQGMEDYGDMEGDD